VAAGAAAVADDPWDVSGPHFLIAYGAAFLIAVIISVIVRRRFWHAPVPPPRERLSLNELAFLSGGPYLIVDTAIARLVESGALRVQRDGKLHATGERGMTDLDWAIINYVRETPATADVLRRNLHEHESADRAKVSLQQRRLLHEESARQRFFVLLPLLVLLAVGVVRFAIGLSLDRPVGILLGLLVCISIVLVARMSPAAKYQQTKSARKLLTKVKKLGPAETSRLLPVVALTGAAGLVVIGGLQAFPDQDIAMALGPSPSAGSTGSTSSCSSSTGCGSGGCGGGCGG
jgi:uncharacterized protein (TIGR04222 family)